MFDSFVVKPWQENFALDLVTIAFAVAMLVGAWLWTRTGRSKREKDVPIEAAAEDFAGTVTAAYGHIPTFLYAIYIGVFIFAVSYTIISIASGPQY